MAKIEQGINGAFHGRVGTVVGYMWKQRACMRAYRQHINFPNTEGQLQQRTWFVAMVRFAAEAKQALKLGMKATATAERMTESNAFVKHNKQHFTLQEGAVCVAYDKLCIATGPAADVYFHKPQFEEDERVRVDFDKNNVFSRASADDGVYLYAYNSTLGCGLLSAAAARRTKHVAMQLPTEWAGHEVHLYGFVIDKQGRSSNSTYIGVGRVNHYQDRGRYIPIDNQWQKFVDLVDDEATTPTQPQQTPQAHPVALPFPTQRHSPPE